MTTAELELARVEGARTLRNPAVWCALVPSAMWVIANVRGDDGHEDHLELHGSLHVTLRDPWVGSAPHRSDASVLQRLGRTSPPSGIELDLPQPQVVGGDLDALVIVDELEAPLE